MPYNRKVVIINGLPGSGKDTFCELCKHVITTNKKAVFNYSTIDIIKNLAIDLGWEGDKTPKSRDFLARLKQLMVWWDDTPFIYITDRADRIIRSYRDMPIDVCVFVHSRESEEIDRFKEYYGNRAITLLIKRDVEVESTNSSDNNVYNYQYDYVIENNGDKEQLKESAKTFIENIMK
jgi:cytidylate kinase